MYGFLAVVLLVLIRQNPIKKLCRTKRNRTNGYLEQRQVNYAHCEPRKLAMFDVTCIEFWYVSCRNFSSTRQKCAQHVLQFADLLFSSTRLVKLLLWLDKPGQNHVMGNYFVLFPWAASLWE